MSIRCSLRGQRGAVTHFQHRCAPALVALALAAPVLGQPGPGSVGRWDPPPGGYDWPLNTIHAVHLATGNILVWNFHFDFPNDPNEPKLWNPNGGAFTEVPTPATLFCAGHAALADGSVLVVGGGGSNMGHHFGVDEVTLYRSFGGIGGLGPWFDKTPMNYERWYPTCTTLPDGRILTVSGDDWDGFENVPVVTPEIYDPASNTWQQLSGLLAQKELNLYPFMFVAPHPDPLVHKVFYAGPGPQNDLQTWMLDVDAESWQPVGVSPFNGGGGSAVMYEPGKVLKVGGSTDGPWENEAATIDLTDDTPVWISALPMQAARRQHNLVLLADGTVLAVGGTDSSGAPVFTPELYNPETGLWFSMEPMMKERGHHSIALLLADGRVLAAGGDSGNPDGYTAEIFSPPYLFGPGGASQPPPVIGFAPTAVSYGTNFNVILPFGSSVGASEIEKVSFVRLAAVTHRFDQNQRYVPLTFQVGPLSDTLLVDAPVNANDAPPGYYMLFLISDDGVPSVAKYVRLE